MRKERIACKKQFLLFSQCFLPCMVLIFHFTCTLKCCFGVCFNLDQSKILSSGNGLRCGWDSCERKTSIWEKLFENTGMWQTLFQ